MKSTGSSVQEINVWFPTWAFQVWMVYHCLPKVTLTYPLLAHHVQLHHNQEAPTIHLQTRLPVPMRGGWRGSMHQPISSPPPPHTDSPLSPPGSAWDCTQLTSLLPKCVWLVSQVFGSCHGQKFLVDPSRWTKILHNLQLQILYKTENRYRKWSTICMNYRPYSHMWQYGHCRYWQ